jgi:transposase
MSRYSNDLRKLVAKKLINTTTTAQYREVSIEYEIGIDTLRKWKKKLLSESLFDEIHIGGRPTEYDMDGLRQYVEKYPDKYIREMLVEFFIANGQKASIGGIHKALSKLGIELKKKSSHTKKEMKLED